MPRKLSDIAESIDYLGEFLADNPPAERRLTNAIVHLDEVVRQLEDVAANTSVEDEPEDESDDE